MYASCFDPKNNFWIIYAIGSGNRIFTGTQSEVAAKLMELLG